ncbi:MAG: chemotaxis protein CheY [Nitrospira bacterium SG8_3]|nr:MAG: chemotaxis protein CheY [Nitrospira bacterium SG8_3]
MSEKVLLVDDEEDFLDAVAERMRARGIEVSTTTSARDALEMIEEKSYDAIVMDLMMPELEGTEALKAIKNRNGELQVIMLTGYVTPEQVDQAKKFGAMDIMEKPPDLDVLIEKIKKAHEKKEGILAEKQAEEGIPKK